MRGQATTRKTGDNHPGNYQPGITRDGFMDGTWSSMEMTSAIKEFVHAGKDITDLLFRCRFKDARERNAVIAEIRRCEKFHLDSWKATIINWCAGSDSENAERMMKLLEAVIGGFREKGRRHDGRSHMKSYSRRDGQEQE